MSDDVDDKTLAEAKRWYEMSDQGAWEDLTEWQKAAWIGAVKEEDR